MSPHPLQTILCALLASALAAGGCRDPSPAPPRVFLVTVDTLRADHLGLYGYPRDTSPFLDSLGEEGLVFATAYSSCSHTAPSHASLFTSLQPAQHRVLRNGEELHESLPTLARLFRDQGYRTAAITTTSFLKGLDSGFDHFHHETRYHPAKILLDRAAEWIRSRETREKLFVWIHLFDVHEWSRDDHVDREALEEVRDRGPSGETLLDFLGREHGTDLDFGGAKVRRAVDRYDAQILSADRGLALFYDAMTSDGLARDALWVVTSDHGEGLGNHRYMGHGKTVYDEQIRVPLLFYFADRRFTPRRLPGLARLVDVAPTLAELLGTSFDGGTIPAVGRSFLPLFEDPEAAWDVRTVFAQRRPADDLRLRQGWIPGEVFALRTERYKLIGHSGAENEVYDLERDPFELENLAGNGSAELERLLAGLERSYRALVAQGEHVGAGEINPEYVEELRALGYL